MLFLSFSLTVLSLRNILERRCNSTKLNIWENLHSALCHCVKTEAKNQVWKKKCWPDLVYKKKPQTNTNKKRKKKPHKQQAPKSWALTNWTITDSRETTRKKQQEANKNETQPMKHSHTEYIISAARTQREQTISEFWIWLQARCATIRSAGCSSLWTTTNSPGADYADWN